MNLKMSIVHVHSFISKSSNLFKTSLKPSWIGIVVKYSKIMLQAVSECPLCH